MSQQSQPPVPDAPTPASDTTAAPADYTYPGPSGADFLQAQAPTPARPANVGLGIVAALVAALAAAAAYGGIMNALEREISYAAVGVGAIIGFAAGKLGGRNPILPIVGAVLSVVSVFLGQLFYYALAIAGGSGAGLGDVLSTLGVAGLVDIWKEDADVFTFLFLALGAFVGFSTAKKIGD
ncbi:hypothetical protein [Streptomyces sp. NPDC059957]|uniref:hypothetical protein n=1 Tax=unclassified Streptomyces TaxID=2593676 RepID=UPI00364FD195